MIACKQAVDRLWDYLDRHLGESEEAELESHLGLCRHCCGELEFAKRIRGKLAGSGAAPLPSDVRGRLETILRKVGS
jgi:anti-sigma factor (TIGR02949 family)